MADEKDDQQALVDEIEAAMEKAGEAEEAGDEMDAIDHDDDSESSSEMVVIVNSPEPVKSKGKGKKKKKKERKSTPTGAAPTSIVSPSTSGSKKRGRPKGSKDKKPHRTLAFDETIGDGLTFHRLTVNPGEDLIEVMEKFNSEYKDRNVCIISSSGTASKVEVHSTPDPLKYEGLFQVISLSVGPRIFGGIRVGDSQNEEENKLIASLSTFNGSVIGGILVGQFIAASPIHIIVGTFKRIISGESSSTANLASEDVGVAPENVSANQNMSTASEDV